MLNRNTSQYNTLYHIIHTNDITLCYLQRTPYPLRRSARRIHQLDHTDAARTRDCLPERRVLKRSGQLRQVVLVLQISKRSETHIAFDKESVYIGKSAKPKSCVVGQLVDLCVPADHLKRLTVRCSPRVRHEPRRQLLSFRHELNPRAAIFPSEWKNEVFIYVVPVAAERSTRWINTQGALTGSSLAS